MLPSSTKQLWELIYAWQLGKLAVAPEISDLLEDACLVLVKQ